MPANTGEILAGFDKVLVCELNSGQFANYLLGLFPETKILKFNKVQGQPFLVSELVDAIKEAL